VPTTELGATVGDIRSVAQIRTAQSDSLPASGMSDQSLLRASSPVEQSDDTRHASCRRVSISGP
jgi:hypothetical protein